MTTTADNHLLTLLWTQMVVEVSSTQLLEVSVAGDEDGRCLKHQLPRGVTDDMLQVLVTGTNKRTLPWRAWLDGPLDALGPHDAPSTDTILQQTHHDECLFLRTPSTPYSASPIIRSSSARRSAPSPSPGPLNYPHQEPSALDDEGAAAGSGGAKVVDAGIESLNIDDESVNGSAASISRRADEESTAGGSNADARSNGRGGATIAADHPEPIQQASTSVDDEQVKVSPFGGGIITLIVLMVSQGGARV